MKDKFRNWRPQGGIDIKYKDENKVEQRWQARTLELILKIQTIVDNYMDQGIRLTNRQLYYQLVGKAYIPNAIEIYKRISTLMTDMRYAGLLDWSAIEDRGRVPTKHSEWKNVSSLIASAVYSYRLPRWEGQKYYLELYCEKQAMESILKPIADMFHIYFGYNKGYSSASTMYDLAQRIGKQINNGKQVVILYLGDHDPSGLDMIRDVNDRVYEFLIKGENYTEPLFEISQIALNKQQINKYNPPPNPAKVKDPRAGDYIAEHGAVSWELDSLTPETLIELTTENIHKYLDTDKYDAVVKKEEKQIKALEKFGKTL